MADSFVTSLQIETFEYKPPVSQKNGSKTVYVSTVSGSTDWKDRIRFQMSEDNTTNLQKTVWGLSAPLSGQESNKRTLELTIESPNLLKFLNELDIHNVKCATENCESWFKKKMDKSAIEEMYVPIVKPKISEDSTDTVKIKVKCQERPTNIYIVDKEENGKMSYSPGSINDLVKGVKVFVMVETAGLWFMSKQFGMSLTALDMFVWPNKTKSGINAFTLSPGTTFCLTSPPVTEDITDIDTNEAEVKRQKLGDE